jgi:hypothetical protein
VPFKAVTVMQSKVHCAFPPSSSSQHRAPVLGPTGGFDSKMSEQEVEVAQPLTHRRIVVSVNEAPTQRAGGLDSVEGQVKFTFNAGQFAACVLESGDGQHIPIHQVFSDIDVARVTYGHVRLSTYLATAHASTVISAVQGLIMSAQRRN